ncbi:hypothetical protein [Pseudomonas lini]
MTAQLSSNSAASVNTENFNDMEKKDYQPGEGFDRRLMTFSLSENSSTHMSIVSTTGSNVEGKALALRNGTLQIKFQEPRLSFGFWFTNAPAGFKVRVFDVDNTVIAEVTEPNHGGGEKEFKYQTTQKIKKIQITNTADSVLIDSIQLPPVKQHH